MFEFLPEKGISPIFSKLPFPVLMQIASYAPRLPKLHGLIWKTIHFHFQKRFCERCGKILSLRYEKYICTCYSRKKKYTCALRPIKYYIRPFFIFSKPSVSFSRFDYKMQHCHYFIKVGSNQPEFVFSFKKILKQRSLLSNIVLYLSFDKNVEDLCNVLIRKVLNTNTCLRQFMDGFIDDSNESQMITAFQKQVFKNARVCHIEKWIM